MAGALIAWLSRDLSGLSRTSRSANAAASYTVVSIVRVIPGRGSLVGGEDSVDREPRRTLSGWKSIAAAVAGETMHKPPLNISKTLVVLAGSALPLDFQRITNGAILNRQGSR